MKWGLKHQENVIYNIIDLTINNIEGPYDFLKQIFRAIGKEIINCLYSVTDLCKSICKARGGVCTDSADPPPQNQNSSTLIIIWR